jgi:hypothetical protein
MKSACSSGNPTARNRLEQASLSKTVPCSMASKITSGLDGAPFDPRCHRPGSSAACPTHLGAGVGWPSMMLPRGSTLEGARDPSM